MLLFISEPEVLGLVVEPDFVVSLPEVLGLVVLVLEPLVEVLGFVSELLEPEVAGDYWMNLKSLEDCLRNPRSYFH